MVTCTILQVHPCRTRSLAQTLCPFSASFSTSWFWFGVSLTWLRSRGAGLYPLVITQLQDRQVQIQIHTKDHVESQFIQPEISLSPYVFGSLIFLRFSSAFSSPIPTWQPSARRVLWNNKDTGINNCVQGHKICPVTLTSLKLKPLRTTITNSLESLARHLQVVVPFWFRETLEVHQTGMEFLVVIPEL